MAINTIDRTNAHNIHGVRIWFIPDGTAYGQGEQTSSLANVPTFEEAIATGRILGEMDTFKWQPEYKEVIKKGFSYDFSGYHQKKDKIRIGVAAVFSTQDVNPEAIALEYGLSAIPAAGESSQAFSNPSGSFKGWLYVARRAGMHTLPDDPNLAEVHVYGHLSLADNPEYNDDLLKVSYEFQVTKTPSESFTNVGLPEMP